VKQGDVKIRGIYRTYVSGTLVKVRVTGRNIPGRRMKTVFSVERLDNGRKLDPRTAAALRSCSACKCSVPNVLPSRDPMPCLTCGAIVEPMSINREGRKDDAPAPVKAPGWARFSPMHGDPGRCSVCHAEQGSHTNGVCPPDTWER